MNGHSREKKREDRPSSSTPLAKQPLFCSNTWYMQIKGCRVEHEVTASDDPSMMFDMRGLNRHLCTDRGTPKTEGDIPWTFPARAGDLSRGRNKTTGAASGARFTVGSGDLQLHEPAEAQNSAWWRRWSRLRGFYAGLRVRFLYLLYRKHQDKSPVLAARLSQAIPTRYNRLANSIPVMTAEKL